MAWAFFSPASYFGYVYIQQNAKFHLISVQDGMIWREKIYMCSNTSILSFIGVALETVPVLV